jgi:hypothetical protein
MRFRCMLHIFYLDVTKVDLVLHIYTYIASVCFKCFSCFKHMLQVFYLDTTYGAVAIHVYCKCMFQMFHMFQTYAASVSSGCCICFRHMLQASIQNVSSISDVCCKRMFVNISHVLDAYFRSAFIL